MTKFAAPINSPNKVLTGSNFLNNLAINQWYKADKTHPTMIGMLAMLERIYYMADRLIKKALMRIFFNPLSDVSLR